MVDLDVQAVERHDQRFEPVVRVTIQGHADGSVEQVKFQ